MNMIIGGSCQGKLEYAMRRYVFLESDICFGESCDFSEPFEKAVLYGFHSLIKRIMLQERSSKEYLLELLERNPDVLIISDEIGYGIVPIDGFLRKWREETGRVCTLAAEKASKVERIIAGIPICIKGEQL